MSPKPNDRRDERPISRREVLALATTGASLGLGGCVSTGSRRGDQPTATPTDSTETPSRSPTSTETPEPSPTPFERGRASPAPACRDGYSPIDPHWVVEGPGPLGGFELTLDTDVFEHGDTLTARLTNVTEVEQTTGVKKKYDIQTLGGGGWYSIFGTENGLTHVDEPEPHAPGEGFTWELTLTRDGLTNAVRGSPTYYACEEPTFGTYRFVYWSVTPNDALGVPFTIT